MVVSQFLVKTKLYIICWGSLFLFTSGCTFHTTPTRTIVYDSPKPVILYQPAPHYVIPHPVPYYVPHYIHTPPRPQYYGPRKNRQ